MIWEEPETDGNSYILAYRVDWHKPGTYKLTFSSSSTTCGIHLCRNWGPFCPRLAKFLFCYLCIAFSTHSKSPMVDNIICDFHYKPKSQWQWWHLSPEVLPTKEEVTSWAQIDKLFHITYNIIIKTVKNITGNVSMWDVLIHIWLIWKYPINSCTICLKKLLVENVRPDWLLPPLQSFRPFIRRPDAMVVSLQHNVFYTW